MTSPKVASSKPAKTLNKVDFPQPDGTTRTINSP